MRHRDPLQGQVRSEADLRYGQSLADLLTARHTAHRQYQTDVQTAKDSARAIKKGAKQAVGQLKQIFDQADRTRQIAGAQIDAASNLASMPHNALTMALQAERGLAGQNFAGEKAAAQSEAVSRGQDATAGLVYAKKNALEGYRATRSDLMSQTRGLHSQIGAFAQSRLGELQSQQAQAQFEQDKFAETKRHNQATEDISAGVNPATGKPLRKPRTPSEQRQVNSDTATARDAIGEARTWIQRLSKGNPIQKAVGLLKTGGSLPVPTGQTDTRGQPKVHYLTVPKISGDFLRAAVELEGKGFLSKTSIHNLRMRNIHIPKDWMTPRTPQQAGQKLAGTVLKGTQPFAGARLKG